MARQLSSSAAKLLSEEIKSGLALTEKKIRKFIDGQGWTGCGYDTFHSWWKAELGDLTLAREIRPHIMYQMFEEGKTDLEVHLAVKGIGPETIRVQRDKFEQGLPASVVVVPAHARAVQVEAPRFCSVEFETHEEYKFALSQAKNASMTISQYGRAKMMGII